MNKKVLITGGAGFVGANFAHRLVDLKYDITIIEKEDTRLWRLDKIKDAIKVVYISLENYDVLEALVLRLQPQIILHFAAYGVYPAKQQDITTTVNTNLIGTINLVNACAKTTFECFINTSTIFEYGIKEKPIKESDSLAPENLYAITKSAATMYCQMMAKKFDLPIITVRPFTIYGYFEEKERLIPTIITACLTNTQLKLSGPNSVRDFIFIEDAIDSYLKIVKSASKIKGQVFNIGSGKQTSIKEAVATIKKLTKSGIQPLYGQVQSAYREPLHWVADISKIKKALKFTPKYHLEKGLKKNIAWFKKNIHLYIKNHGTT